MLTKSIDSYKKLVANMLNFYGVKMVRESLEPRSSDSIDVVASVDQDDKPEIGIKFFDRKPRASEYFGALNTPSLRYVFFIAPDEIVPYVKEKMPATTSLLEKDVYVFPTPSTEHPELEDKIRSLTNSSSSESYFRQESRKPEATRIADTHELDSFREQISSQGLSSSTAERLIYQAAVGGLSIESGTKIRHNLGKMILRRNENLSREAIFLEALGILKESEKATVSNMGEEGKVYLTLDQSENTTRLANQVITEMLEYKKRHVEEIISSYPPPFFFTVILGSMGIFAPRQPLPPERSSTYNLGVLRTTFESENTYLVETIRELVNAADITTVEWNRINTLASYPEINNLIQQFYERFERTGIGVKGHRGVKRIYLPVAQLTSFLGLSSYKDSYNKAEMRKYVIWDTILNYRAYQQTWAQRLDSLGLDAGDISGALKHTMERRMTSGVLPEGSFMPFAVYNSHAFRNYCLERMREAASAILDITW